MMVIFQMLLQPFNNVFASSIYGMGGEVEKSNSRGDGVSDVRGRGCAMTNIQAARSHPEQL